MIKLFSLLLGLLLFSGCAAQNPPEETTPPITSPQTAQVTESFFLEAIMADDALQQYRLSEPLHGFLPMGQHLLLFSGSDTTTLSLVNPDTGKPLSVQETDLLLTPENFTVQLLSCGLSWFDGAAMETVVLDDSLREVRRIAAPEDLTGAPLLSANGRSLFYCTPTAVRVLDLSTGVSRILKEASYPVQGLSGLLLSDTVLQISITDTDGSWRTLFLSAETGRLLQECEGNVLPRTTADSYFVRSADNDILFGQTGEIPMLLHPKQHDSDCFFLPDTYTAMTAAMQSDATLLTLYDLATGGRIAEQLLKEPLSPRNVCGTPDGAIWFLSEENSALYRWRPEACPVSDLKQYSSPFFTRDNPDYEGLAACGLLAGEIGTKHGLQILIYKDAAALEPWDYHLEYEYQASVLRRELEALDARLSQFPTGFLNTLAQTFTALRICIVGDIIPTANGPETVSGIQFLDGYDAYIVLSTREDTEKALYHELCHLMETVVLTRSTAYDRWENLNPEGFQYGNHPQDSPYLQDGRAYFIDTYAMTQPKEDRARLFEYAMTAGHEALFRSPSLQRKLLQLSIGIREAFSLEDYPGALPWEQYLSA